jgi:hypothetical protein
MSAASRIATAGIWILLSGAAAIEGVNLIGFGMAQQGFADQPAQAGSWSETEGVGSLALAARLQRPKKGEAELDPADRRGILGDLLAVKPLSPEHWLQLASVMLAEQKPQPQIEAALLLSGVTGPNEGSTVLSQRAVFGVSLWENLSPVLQHRVAADLAGAPLNETDLTNIRVLLATKPEPVRDRIRETLLAQGISPAGIVAMGL